MSEGQEPRTSPGHDFRTTHWSIVLQAALGPAENASQALESLCSIYWHPLYSYIRRKGYQAEEAKDLTQAFFERFLEKDYLQSVDASKGKFRSFLLACLNNFLANEWDRARTRKRGGDYQFVAMDAAHPEAVYNRDELTEASPERDYERRWTRALLERVLSRLEDEYTAGGKSAHFTELKVFLVDDKGVVPYVEIQKRLGLSESAVKSAIRRLRLRYFDLFREEVARTVNSESEIEAEIRHLLSVLSG